MDMAHHRDSDSESETNECQDSSYEEVLAQLSDIVISEDRDLRSVAAAKLRKLVEELERGCSGSDDALDRIQSGFYKFKTQYFEQHPEFFADLAERQSPKFLVFACSDSRVSPSHVLDFKPGEAFMVRNIANIVPPFDQIKYSGVGAVIEYAVNNLHVKNILIVGHSRCGGIKGLMQIPADGTITSAFVEDWMLICKSAKDKVLAEHPSATFEEKCYHCEKEAVNVSLSNLLTYPFVRNAVVSKKLTLRGAHYDFVDGIFQNWTLDVALAPSKSTS